jgi:hypothetical protein
MARVHVVLPHSLDIDTAEARLRCFLDAPALRERLKMTEARWGNRNVELAGENWSGRAYVTARDVEVDLELGGMLGFFAGAAESELKKRLAEALR